VFAVVFSLVFSLVFEAPVLSPVVFTFFQFNCGVRAGFLKGSKVADFLRILVRRAPWGVVGRTALLNGLIDSFCARLPPMFVVRALQNNCPHDQG
jgi:hypothetical protein